MLHTFFPLLYILVIYSYIQIRCPEIDICVFRIHEYVNKIHEICLFRIHEFMNEIYKICTCWIYEIFPTKYLKIQHTTYNLQIDTTQYVSFTDVSHVNVSVSG